MDWLLITPTKVVRVDNGLIYLKNTPLTNNGKIKWWKANRGTILKKYHLIKDDGRVNISLMKFGGYVSLPTGSNDGDADDYNCYSDIKDNKKCIYKDIVMYIGGNVHKTIIYNIGGKTYSETPDGEITSRGE